MTRSRLGAMRLRWCAAGLVFAALVATAVADPVAPTASDRQVTLAITSLLRREHLSRHAVDDEISERCLKGFLKALDPMKVYFYQSDADEFDKQRHELDDMAKRGDVSFAYTVFKTFLKRIDERVKLVDEFLKTDQDFAVDEEMPIDRDTAQYAKTEAEAREKWRKRIKYDLLVLKADKTVGQEARDKLARRYHSFAKRMHQTDNEELLEMYLTSLTTAFDPHTSYMAPRTLENFEIIMKLELEGIGASLQSDDGYTKVHKIIPGGAAAKDGRLKVGDRIVGVGQGKEGEIVDVVDMKLSDVVALIRGKQGTIVRLQVTPVDKPDRKIIEITRAKIELKDSEAQAEILRQWFVKLVDGKPVAIWAPTAEEALKSAAERGYKTAGEPVEGQPPYKVGVINLPSFYMDMAGAKQGLPDFRSTTRDVKQILDNFNKKGVDAVVLDLRGNGGGSLTEAINLTGLFIEDGPVVQVKDADGRVQPYLDLDPEIAWKGPLVVLISKFSASASEILAGAIQDYHRGLIVGDRTTHGKGTVQSLLDLGQQLFRVPNSPKLGALKITMQQFYRPCGDSTQNRGVVSDILLPALTTHLDVGESDLDYSMKFDRVDPLTYKNFNLVTKAIIDKLTELSEPRCRDSKDFQKVDKDIARYKEQKAKKSVTLNEKKFMAERAELNADDEEKKTLEKLNDPNRPAIERDYYLNEVLAITADYLNLLRGGQPAGEPPRQVKQ
jgi:carboxyl-terminal processing protease